MRRPVSVVPVVSGRLRLADRVVKNVHHFNLHDVALSARPPSSLTARPRRDFPQSPPPIWVLV